MQNISILIKKQLALVLLMSPAVIGFAQNTNIDQLVQQAKASGKSKQFSSIHNFNAAFLPGYNDVVLYAAHGYKAYDDKIVYTDIDYRKINIGTMNYQRLDNQIYWWDTDRGAETRSERVTNNLLYKAAFVPGTAPDSIEKEQLQILKPFIKPRDYTYADPQWRFVKQLQDGSLIYAVSNRKQDKYKADIELYRRPNPASTVIEKYFVLPGLHIPDLNIIISDNGKRVLYIEPIYNSTCPVYDVPSKKKIALVDLKDGNFYQPGVLMKFSPSGDTLITCTRPSWLELNSLVIATGKKTIGIAVSRSNFKRDFDENTEEYDFWKSLEFPEVRRDIAPYLMDFTPDGKKVLIATTNKLGIMDMNDGPTKFISSMNLNLYRAITHRLFVASFYPAISAQRKKAADALSAENYRKQNAEYERRSAAAAASREANEQSIAEYKRTHGESAPLVPKNNTGTGISAADAEAKRHKQALEENQRSIERMNERAAKAKQ